MSLERVPEGKLRRCVALFREFFKISLFVVGGGYAIAAVADEVFGRKLKWLDEGDILDHMPIIATVPGLVAGNTAIYTGLRIAGRAGALAALVAVALPSYLVFTAVTLGFAEIPQGNPWLEGAFLGLRSALTGVMAGTVWKTLRRGPVDWTKGVGLSLDPLPARKRLAAGAVFAVLVGAAAWWCPAALVTFLCFGCVCIGGGYPLIPFYFRTFVGSDAPLVQMTPEAFSNLMALTQMTPGPVSVNAATFFGHALGGIVGGAVATAALLTPSYFLMTAALGGLERWRTSRTVHVLVALLKPIAVALMCAACWKFAGTSVWTVAGGSFEFHPLAAVLAVLAALALATGRMSIMALVISCAGIGAASVWIG